MKQHLIRELIRALPGRALFYLSPNLFENPVGVPSNLENSNLELST